MHSCVAEYCGVDFVVVSIPVRITRGLMIIATDSCWVASLEVFNYILLCACIMAYLLRRRVYVVEDLGL